MAVVALAGMFAAGCGESVPESPVGSRVSGSPEERIQAIQNDPRLTEQEKAQRIAVVKQRNNLK